MKVGKFDFSGYATKNGLKCTDGRVILKDAFKHQDGATVPLVWQHLSGNPSNVLGHAVLENRDDGVYCYGFFNNTDSAKDAKEFVEHGDVKSLSIYANQLQEQSKNVIHGAILEVSLVLAGANPGATIDNISFSHSDGSMSEDDSEVIIRMGLELEHSATKNNSEQKTIADVFNTFTDEQKDVVHALIGQAITDNEAANKGSIEHAAAATSEKTIKDVFDSMSEEQKQVVYYMIGQALDGDDGDDGDGEAKHSNINLEGDSKMKKNVFDQSITTADGASGSHTLSHDQLTAIVTDAKRFGSLRDSFMAHAADYGFDPIDILFPDAQDVNNGEPITIQRDTTWVNDVLSSTNHTPFARIRSRFADITAEEARAKGYVTGALKKEEVITLMKRVTTPTTIYKKQKLDRDDMVDITDFDVVIWLKKEMRGMLNEELARAVLIGDGRNIADEDKINEQNIRPIATDDASIYVQRKVVAYAETTDNIIDEFIRARKNYKGSGVPALYISTDLLTEMLLLKDDFKHRLYKTIDELASVLRVSRIVEVEPMNTATHTIDGKVNSILGIIVNLKDYTIGANKGGDVALFDDFDIDYNQYKYLIETRCSGALTQPKSAIVMERAPQA